MIRVAEEQDWHTFMALARQEGWRVPRHELILHQQGGCSQAWALRRHNATIGLITGVRHHGSAWIGNLIIAEAERGRGYGLALFTHVVRELRAAGALTLWLTASAQGAPLYTARGFHPVGEVERWVRKEGGAGVLPCAIVDGKGFDRIVWGDDRSALLRHLERSGRWLEHEGSTALLQQGDDLQIIGPWYGALRLRDDAELLARLVAAAAPEQELVVDLLASSGRQDLLTDAGFTLAGRTGLMVCGPTQVQWSRLIALATLGSCG